MKTRQVFSAYNHKNLNRNIETRFCPDCGSICDWLEAAGRERHVCRKCGFIHYKNPLPAVCVLIADGDRILMGKRSPDGIQPGLWSLPCGFIEHDEDFLTAAHREVLEETGLQIKISSIINVAHNFLSPLVHSLVIVMLAEPCGGRLAAGDDMVELRWFSPHDQLPELAFEADSHLIEMYRAGRLGHLPVDQAKQVIGLNEL